MQTQTLKLYAIGSALVIVMFFATIEAVTRTVSWASEKGFRLQLHELDPLDAAVADIYRWHPFVGFTFAPNSIVESGHPNQKESARILIDGHGFLARDHGLTTDKAPNEIRVATIGASTTANLHLAYDENWPGRLGELLERTMPGKTVRVINAAVPGFDTAQSIGNLSLRVMPFKPDVVVIYHAYNDMKAAAPTSAFRPDYAHIHGTPYGYHPKPSALIRGLNHSMFYVRMRNRYREARLAQARLDADTGEGRLASIPTAAEQTFDQHIRALIGVARAGGARVVLSSFATLHDLGLDYHSQETFVGLSSLQQRELAALVHFTPSLTLPGVIDGFNRYNAVLRRVGAQEKTGWVDNGRLIPHEDTYFVDRVHFSREGAALMAKNLLPVVLEQLRK